MPPSLLRLSTPTDLNLLPNFGHPFPSQVDIKLFFSISIFRFFFFLIFFGGVLSFFLFFLVASALFFCFFFFFGRLCPVFFFGVRRREESNFVPVLAWGPKGGCPKPEKVGARRVRTEGWRPKGGGLKGGGPKGGGFKISLFLPLSPQIFVIFFSLWWSSRGIVAAVQGCGAHEMHVWASLWPAQNARLGFSGGHFARAPRRRETLKLFLGLNG